MFSICLSIHFKTELTAILIDNPKSKIIKNIKNYYYEKNEKIIKDSKFNNLILFA